MIWKIAKKEFLLNLMTFKFAVGTLLCVVLTAAFVLVLVNDYQERLNRHSGNIAANEAELKKVMVYKNITPTVYRPPTVLSVFSEGSYQQLGHSAKIELDSLPEITSALAEANPFLSVFPVLDVTLILKVVISILALLVAYDVISGERERGTLRLILSGTVARYEVLLGKLLAGLMTLIVPITITFIVGLLILELSPMVDLTRSDQVRIGLMYLASLIFISVMYNFGLLFSCLTRRSAISLILVLLCWVIYTVVIPNGSVCLATHIRPLQRREKIDDQLVNLRKERQREQKELIANLGPLGGQRSGDIGAFGREYTRALTKSYSEYEQKRCALLASHFIKYADRVWEVEHRYLNSLLEQKHLANNLSRASPISLYENVMCALAGTHAASCQYFVNRARTYRNEVIEYIRSKTNDFSLPSYFTPFSEEDMIAYGKLRERLHKAAGEERGRVQGKLREMRQADKPALGLHDFPRFVYKPESIAKTVQSALPDLVLLISISTLFYVLSSVVFLRYDVR